MEINEEVISTIFIGYMKFKSQFCGLNKKSNMQERTVLDLLN